jgi:FkbM family methyltransferase
VISKLLRDTADTIYWFFKWVAKEKIFNSKQSAMRVLSPPKSGRVQFTSPNFEGGAVIAVRTPRVEDKVTALQVFYDADYDLFSIGISIKSGERDLIVDLGANIGLSVVYFRVTYPSANILALEPSHSNFDLLKKNTAGLDSIELIQGAIGPENSSVLFAGGVKQAGNELQFTPQGEGESSRVIKFEELIRGYEDSRRLILKVDIEGAEEYLFDDRNWALIAEFKIVIVEIHDWMSPTTMTSTGIFRFLAKHPRRVLIKGENLVLVKDIENV